MLAIDFLNLSILIACSVLFTALVLPATEAHVAYGARALSLLRVIVGHLLYCQSVSSLVRSLRTSCINWRLDTGRRRLDFSIDGRRSRRINVSLAVDYR